MMLSGILVQLHSGAGVGEDGVGDVTGEWGLVPAHAALGDGVVVFVGPDGRADLVVSAGWSDGSGGVGRGDADVGREGDDAGRG